MLFNNNQGQLVDFDPVACTHTPILDIGIFTDLASHPNGFIYSLSANGNLFSIDPITGDKTMAASFPGSKYYGLTANAFGEIYAASETGELSSYNPASGQVSLYEKMGYGASGDLTYYKGTLYMATTDNTLVSIYPDDPSLNEVLIDFSSSGSSIFGIVSAVQDCEVRTYAISGGVSANIYEIDWENKSFNFVCTIPQNVYGGTSSFEFLASEAPISIEEIVIDQRACDTVDNTISISAQSVNSPTVTYSLDDVDYAASGVFEDLPFGMNTIFIKDEFGCMYEDSFDIVPGFLTLDSQMAEPSFCAENNGSISLAITSSSSNNEYVIDGIIPQSTGVFTDLAPSDYNYTITNDAGCSVDGSITVDSVATARFQEFVETQTYCQLDNGALELIYNTNGLDLMYSLDGGPFQSNSIFENLAAGEYIVNIRDNNDCSYQQTLMVTDDESNCNIYIPNTFSPNGDGVNDQFLVYSEYALPITEFLIYDRWGSLIFTRSNVLSNDIDNGWDGTFKNNELQPGTYSFIVKIKTQEDLIVKNGSVTLVK